MKNRSLLCAALVCIVTSAAVIAVNAGETHATTVKPSPQKDANACDLDLGKRTYIQCAICHRLDETGASTVGPNLSGVIDRPAATVAGFSYSEALKNFAKPWTPSELDAFLKQPMIYLPGTRMAFAGIKDQAERDAVVCYIKEKSK